LFKNLSISINLNKNTVFYKTPRLGLDVSQGSFSLLINSVDNDKHDFTSFLYH